MRLESALYSTMAGLNGHSKALAVLGDNVSNVNTPGYKRSRTEFADIVTSLGNQSERIAATGNGVHVPAIKQVHRAGVLEPTGRSLDMAIEGTGFFQVGDPTNPSLTRAGNFQVNEQGILSTASGDAVLGIAAGSTELAPIDLLSLDLASSATTQIQVTGNLDASEAAIELPDDPDTFIELNGQTTWSNTVEIYDSLGNTRGIAFYYTKTDANTWTAQAYVDGADIGGEAGEPELIGTAELTFGEDGVIAEANEAAAQMTITPAWEGGAAQGDISVDLSGFTQFSALSQPNNIFRDGAQAGTNIRDYEVDSDGAIYAVLNTGDRSLLATFQLATVSSVESLTRQGSGLFATNDKTGELAAGQPGSGAFGTTTSKALERSNVDITTEFTDLVLYQSGYQANSQLLSAANEMLRNAIALIR